jgi:hypothetical protein
LVFKNQGVTEAGFFIDKYLLPGKAYFRRDFPASITPWFLKTKGLLGQGNRKAKVSAIHPNFMLRNCLSRNMDAESLRVSTVVGLNGSHLALFLSLLGRPFS